MRWVFAAVAVVGLAACAPGGDHDADAAIGRASGCARAASTDSRDRLPRRARVSAPAAESSARASAPWPPPDAREPTDPPPPPPGVVGCVVDANGEPVAHANVACFFGVSTEESTTDREGRFLILIDEPTGVVRCIAWADGWAVHVGPWHAMAEDEYLDVGTIALAPAARISGRVVDEAGEELTEGHWRVRVDGSDVFGRETWALLADLDEDVTLDWCRTSPAHGRFEFSSLPPGRYRIEAQIWPDDDSRFVTSDATVVAAPAEDVVLRAVDPDPPHAGPFRLCVRVVRPPGDDAPIESVALDVESDAEGEILWTRCDEVSGLRDDVLDVTVVGVPLPFRLLACAPDGTSGAVEIEEPTADEIVIELGRPKSEAPSIRGVVTSGGEPVRWEYRYLEVQFASSRAMARELVGTQVRIVAARADDTGDDVFALTAPDGTFRLEALDAAEYRISACVKESDGIVELAAATAFGRPGALATLDMPRAGRRSFRVALPVGANLDEVDTRAELLEWAPDDVEIDVHGTLVTATRLRPGVPYRLAARARVGRTWTAWTRVEGWTAGDEVLDVVLDPGLRIEGTVVREDGSPVPGAYLYAEAERDCDEFTECYAGLDGRFVLTGVGAGRWTVTATAPALSNDDSPLVTHGGSTGVLVVLRPRPGE